MEIEILEFIPGEIAHFYEPSTNTFLYSMANRFWGCIEGAEFEFSVPISLKTKVFTATRLSRRLTRTDKSSAVFNFHKDGIVILYLGKIYFFDLQLQKLQEIDLLKQSRNILHCGFSVTQNAIFFGEYGKNRERMSVPIWTSNNDGRDWEVIHELPKGSAKHIHGFYSDPFSKSLWMVTGDNANECYLYQAPKGDVKNLKRHGNGEQEWRPVSLFFNKKQLIWGMDSPLTTSHLQVFDRKTCEITQGQAFPGPIWYTKQFEDGLSILQTSVEIGPGSKSKFSHLYVSKNQLDWNEVARYKKDIFSMKYLKFGVIAFADGQQSSNDFVMFGEALKGFDGKIARVAIKGGRNE